MAGRPAARGGGLTGLHYGLITFVALTVAALAGFIFSLTNLKRAQDEAAAANRRLAAYGNPPAYYADEAAARSGGRVFDVIRDDLRTLATAATGQPEAVGVAVKREVETVLSAIEQRHPGTVTQSMPLLAAVREMDRALTAAKESAAAVQTELKDVQAEKEALAQQMNSVREEFAAQVAELGKRVEQIEREKAEALAAKDAQYEEARVALETLTEERNRDRVEVRRSQEERDIEMARLRSQIEAQQEKIGQLEPSGFDPDAILTKADGRILQAVPGSDLVYINLGEQHRLRSGMGFEVYSRTREVPRSLRGKASIEIVAVMDSTAEARVVRSTPGQPIIEGDLIVNIAYERNRQPKFVIRGEFDLNYDGEVDFDGMEKIAAMIRRWGGQVVDELDESTDFVIVGQAPHVPIIQDPSLASLQVRDQAQTKALARGAFEDLVNRANSLFIPVLTQNQFLLLAGYTDASMMAAR